MTRRSHAACAVSLLLLTPAIAHAAFTYGTISYTDIADTFPGSPYTQLVSFPAINNAGQVAFSPLTTSFIQSVLLTPTAPGTPITIADTAHGFTGMSAYSLNNNGVVAFSGTSSTGPNANKNGIFTGNGGTLTTVADSTTTSTHSNGGTPRVNDSSATLFIGEKTEQEITIGQSAAFTTVVQNNHLQFENLFDAAINNSNQVVFNTDDYSTGSKNGAFIYRYTPGLPLVQISRATTSTPVAINDAGVIAFQAADAAGDDTGVFTTNGTTTTAISRVGQNLPGTTIHIDSYAAQGQGTPINNSGLVAIQASDSTLANNGIYVGDGTNTTTIIHPGQSLFGKTVLKFGLGSDAINDSGQLTFNVQFTDNTFAVVRTSGANVPEPASASLLLAAITLSTLRIRPRKKV